MTIVLFEDERTAELAPISLMRPAFDLLCGGRRLVDLVRQIDPEYRCVVRPHLRDVADADFAQAPKSGPSGGRPTVYVNARLVPAATVAGQLEKLIQGGRSGQVLVENQTAIVVTQASPPTDVSQPETLATWLAAQPPAALDAEVSLFVHPHEVVAQHLAITCDNLQDLITRGEYRQVQDGVFLGRDARIGPYVVTDTQAGPIVLDQDAVVRSHCFLRGPIYLGQAATVFEHSSINGPVAAGRETKLGGEITASIIDSNSNKAHHGFLGHSYLGSWVNFGAGTTTSNLKNTYGEVRVDYGGHQVATGMQFLGCLVGDYARTAINTAIFTGKTVGAASLLYGVVTGNVPSFVNYARGLGRSSEFSWAAAVTMQARVFARRGRSVRDCDAKLLQAVFQMTCGERMRWDPELGQGPPVF